MKKSGESLIDFCYRLLNVGIFLSTLICFFSAFFDMTGTVWKHFAVMFMTAALFFAVRKWNKRQQIYTILFMVSFLVIFFGVTGREKLAESFFVTDGFIWTVVLAVLACVLHLWSEKYFFLKISFLVVLYVILLCLLFDGRYVPKTGVALLVLYAVMTLTEYIRISCREKENFHAYFVWIAPFFALYFFILCLMPAPETPYSWQWLKDIYLRVEEKITICAENLVNRNNEDLGGAISGFSERAALFSNIAADDRNIMVIGTAPGKKPSLYLAGKIYDVFDGREWSSTGEGDARERLFDTMETVCALEEYAKGDTDHPIYYNSIQVQMEYRHFHTDYLLAPSKTRNIEGKLGYRQNGADLVFDKKAGYGTEYMLQYCRMNMGRETTKDFLQSGVAEDVDLWGRTVKAYAEDEIPYTELFAYRETMRARYLPETTLTPETEEWLAAVTKEAEDEVDGLFCIEEALADMGYHSNPGGLPKEVTDEKSFLHYFLMEKQEGFCTHFATAFVLLARAEGFPARYVQGFCVPLGNEGETEVYSSMAHAWPEVYLEGKGWIPFEPTPGYIVRRYPAEPEKADKEDDTDEGKESGEKEYAFGNTEILDDEEDGEDAERKEREEKLRELGRAVRFIAICGALVLAVGMLLFIIDRLSERYREKRRSTDEKYRRAVLRNLQILSMIGWERKQAETYQELVERIEEEKGEDAIPTAFITTYENMLYGPREIGERELKECLEQREGLMRILRKQKGRRYVFYWLRVFVT